MAIRPRLKWAATGAVTFEPLTLAEAQMHLRVENSDEDDYLNSLISTARDFVEKSTGHILCQRAFYLEAAEFPSEANPIVLPIGPLVTVTALQYVDPSAATQTMTLNTDYRVQSTIVPARIRPALTMSAWPATFKVDDAVRITGTMGYANAASVPVAAKQAMRMLMSHWYTNRESVNINGGSTVVDQAAASLMRSLWMGEIAP